LGAIIGAHVGIEGFPKRWIDGLAHRDEIEKEIDEFVSFVVNENK
jgi:hypothetical protein